MSELKVYRDLEDYAAFGDYGLEEAYDRNEADKVIAEKDKEIRRLKRALWIARAERAKEMCRRLLIQGFDPKWEEIERKCRAKAEEYK